MYGGVPGMPDPVGSRPLQTSDLGRNLWPDPCLPRQTIKKKHKKKLACEWARAVFTI